MRQLQLPTSFKKIISQDNNLNALITSALADSQEILEDNKLFFFPEYTDHGINHIEGVLEACERLVSTKTLETALNPKDVAFLILSVLLHDLGMHVSFEGFLSILNRPSVICSDIDNETWRNLWEDYIHELRRLPSTKIVNIFGDSSVEIRDCSKVKKGDLTTNDRFQIGEFIRRHHPRLAHEISIEGFPGKTTIPFFERLKEEEKNLVGLIARSHGSDLRTFLRHIEKKYPKSVMAQYGVKAIFLMVVLRLGDYIQIDHDRTSRLLLKTKSLSSPISQKEHNAHLAIEYIEVDYQNDPERIFVNANPPDVQVFLKLDWLLNDIQREFDVSWAVLGEVYGLLAPEKRPEIKYRRLDSNLFDGDYLNGLPFLPQSVRFKANEKLIPLLAEPLYGGNPTFGIRELIQNSVDACLERKKNESAYEPQISVSLYQSEGRSFFKIEDNGRGMGEHEIQNYFLNIGSSLRSSLAWKKEYENSTGESKIRWSGKFGIGVLAAFLIGDKIRVSTRKAGSEQGYTFDITQQDEEIELTKTSNLNVGTTLTIEISESKYLAIYGSSLRNGRTPSWVNWYKFTRPRIGYILDGKNILSEAEKELIFSETNESDRLKEGQFELRSEDFKRIIWDYNPRGTKGNRRERDFVYTCNGITIPHIRHRDFFSSSASMVIKGMPNINVIDYNGNLPLALDRNSLTREPSFQIELEIELLKYIIAQMVHDRSKGYPTSEFDVLNMVLINNPAYNAGHRLGGEVFFSKQGYIPRFFTLSDTLNQRMISMYGNMRWSAVFCEDILEMKFPFREDLEGFFSFVGDISSKKTRFKENIGKAREVQNDLDVEILMQRDTYEGAFRNDFLPKWFHENLKVIYKKQDWVLLRHIEFDGNSSIEDKISNLEGIGFIYSCNSYPEILAYPKYMSRDLPGHLSGWLDHHFGEDPLIPYCLKMVDQKYPQLIGEIEPYLEYFSREKD